MNNVKKKRKRRKKVVEQQLELPFGDGELNNYKKLHGDEIKSYVEEMFEVEPIMVGLIVEEVVECLINGREPVDNEQWGRDDINDIIGFYKNRGVENQTFT